MRGARDRRRRWSSPTRCRRRSAIPRTRATASTSARAWRPSAPSPWRTVPSCLLPSEQEFRRELFRRDTADRPEAVVQGRITDEAGHRVEGAKIRVWFQGTAILDEVSGKDGSFRLELRAGPWTYSVRVSHAGLATEIADLRIDRGRDARCATSAWRPSRRSAAASSTAGEPIGGVTVHALRSPDDPVDAGETQTADDGTFAIAGLDVKRYYLRASKFGWLPADAEVAGHRAGHAGRRSSWCAPASSGARRSTPTARGRRTPRWWRCCRAGLGRDRLADHLDRRQRRRVRAGPVPAGHLLPLGAARRDAGLPAGEDRDQRRATSTPRSSCKLSHRGARVRGRIVTRGGTRARARGARRAVRPVAAGAAAQGGGRDRPRRRLRGRRRCCPGATRSRSASARACCRSSAARARSRSRSSPGATVDLPETIVVRPQAEE